jgi:glycosyltransferase involved in cell wall biosynthesis
MSRWNNTRVRFLGHVKPQEFFSEIDVLVVPSLWNEPMGRVVVEAYGMGVPVLGARRGGIPELIDDGVTGLLFEPEVADVVRVLTRIADDELLRTKVARGARRKATAFTVTHMTDCYEGFYQEVL